ncbi:MAG: V-type ATP synthase subunit K, partial [Fervidicoccaceae archaeon]
ASGLSALAERPEMFSSVLLVVALGEGIAIYGLIVALLLIIM